MIETSSLFELFFMGSNRRVLSIISSSFILDLTLYEIGSILNKGNDSHISGLDKEKTLALSIEFSKVLEVTERVRLEPEDLNKVLLLSLEKGLAFYDAAYIFQSRKLNLALVTDDREMASAGKAAGISVKRAEEIGA